LIEELRSQLDHLFRGIEGCYLESLVPEQEAVSPRTTASIQAWDTFASVVTSKTKGWFNADAKITDADLIFASVQTLSQEQYLHPSYFPSDYFDYIVIDEFHHVAAHSYRRIANYFRPRFMLGITATLYRMDNQDVFQFCEDNVVYEINLDCVKYSSQFSIGIPQD
jgi:superfamily II DNA or RNA helicase